MRQQIRDFGGPAKALNARLCSDNYKGQALFELASREILESEIADLRITLGRILDLVDCDESPLGQSILKQLGQ